MSSHIEHISYTTSAIKAACSNWVVKCIGAVSYSLYAFFFDPVHVAGHFAVFSLIIFDFITGIAAAKKTGEEIKSSKVIRSAIKLVVYFLLIAGARITETAVPILGGVIDETVIAFLALTELISLMENVGKMGYAIPKQLLNKLEKLRDDK